MSNAPREKPWPCPHCGYELGKVLYGQLYLNGEVIANTDGPNLVMRCPMCRTIKTWYANDRLSSIIRELAKEVRNQSKFD